MDLEEYFNEITSSNEKTNSEITSNNDINNDDVSLLLS